MSASPPRYPHSDHHQPELHTDDGYGEGHVGAAAAVVTAEEDGRIGVEIDVQSQRGVRIGAAYLKGSMEEGSPSEATMSSIPPEGSERKRAKAGRRWGRRRRLDRKSEEGTLSEGTDSAQGGGEAYASLSEMPAMKIPPMSIVIFIVGSRGDVQPYIALALALIIRSGHRVRLATHPDFRNFILDANVRLRGKAHDGLSLEGRLEYYDVGGDPKELMAYMVKNPGLLPGLESLTNGDIKRKREMISEYLRGFYRSTFSPDPVSGKEFAADAIISNPPAFAHISIAEALNIPLLMSFTMPWTATSALTHPLVNVRSSNADRWATSWMGYQLADKLMWEGLGPLINNFRTSILRLEPIPDRTASDILDRVRIPWTYCWSPELLPKPRDWRSNIDVSGFYFLDSEDDYPPPSDLAAFLEKGEAPVYIGFGSVVISDPEAMTDVIFEAVENAGVRAVVSAGWAGLGKGRESSDPNIFILSKDCSHEWLFAHDRVAAVCHHGGAGTTACGLRHGRPTIIVPFFGDQKFWGDTVHKAGAGPSPIPVKSLTVAKLTAALQYAISPDVIIAAGLLGERIRAEKGDQNGMDSFERNMPVSNLCCDVDSLKVAVWWCARYSLRPAIDAAAAIILDGRLTFEDLEPYRSKEYDVSKHGMGPFSGTWGAVNDVTSTAFSGTAKLFYSPLRGSAKLIYGVPRSAFGVMGDMFDGCETMAEQMGSTPRRRPRMDNWRTGMMEGSMALWVGVWDGVTGIVTEPIDGARREGAVGFVKGVGRGAVNLLNRPIAGALGMFVQPARGIRASLRSTFGTSLDPHSVLRGPRMALTRKAMSELLPEERKRLLEKFMILEGETEGRQGKLRKFQWFLLAEKEAREAEKVKREREVRGRRERREDTLTDDRGAGG